MFRRLQLTYLMIPLLAHKMGTQGQTRGMFKSVTEKWLGAVSSDQLNYGIAVTDIDNDGEMEMMVAGYNGPNLVLKFNKDLQKLENIAVKGSPYEALMDTPGQAIGLAACDIDGDGREEIYVLNTNRAYSGRSSYGDKLFKFKDGKYVDLYSEEYAGGLNAEIDAKNYAGRSVACVDRYGTGKYSFVVATYASGNDGKFALIEMDESNPRNDIARGTIALKNVAREAGIDRATGGRGIFVGPITNDDGKLDIFFGNEGYRGYADNFLFKNLGNGMFRDVAGEMNIADDSQNVRGIAVADFNDDGMLDIVYGNWMGPHRLFIQEKDSNGKRTFRDQASSEMAKSSSIRTVMTADFDNDGNMEVFYNNINSYSQVPNRLFRVISNGPGQDVDIQKLDIGDAYELGGYGTGGAYTDLDGDGVLEVVLAHGESSSQPLTVYKVESPEKSIWLRVLPLTQWGSPARGATVTLTTRTGKSIKRVIDAGSGYLCEMEPIAHYGLPDGPAKSIRVQWPDGSEKIINLSQEDHKQVLRVPYPKDSDEKKGKGTPFDSNKAGYDAKGNGNLARQYSGSSTNKASMLTTLISFLGIWRYVL